MNVFMQSERRREYTGGLERLNHVGLTLSLHSSLIFAHQVRDFRLRDNLGRA